MSTKSSIKPRRRLLNLVVLTAIGGGALMPASASAAALYWACGSGTWNTINSCWSTTPGGGVTPLLQPVNGDSVFLTQTDATNRSISFQGPASPVSLNSLSIDATGTGTMTLSQSSIISPLTTLFEYVGINGTGVHTQVVSANTIVGSFYLGYNSGGNGTYNLGGGGLFNGALSGNFEFVGYSGTGTFNQTLGTNTANSLYIGANSGSHGTYNLSAGSLSTTSEYVGSFGTGAFNQSGGTNTIGGTLYLGYANGSSGAYTLSGTGSLSANNEAIGRSGTGAFTQTGGTHTVANNLTLGQNAGSNGSYTLSGGTLNVAGIVGGAGISTFNLDGGTLNLTGSSITLDTFNIGNASGSNGSFTLGSGKTLTVSNETIGTSGTGTFSQSGGTHTVSNNLQFGGSGSSGYGTYTLSGGTLNVGGIVDGSADGASGGTFNLDGGTLNLVGSSITLGGFNIGHASGSDGSFTMGSGKTLTVGGETIGLSGTGAFNQTGGLHTAMFSLSLGENSGSQGTYNLSGSGVLLAANETIGGNGSGTFNQSGGTNWTGGVILGGGSGGSGAYSLSAGSLTAVGEVIGYSGAGTFTQTGGTNEVSGNLYIAYGGTGSYTLSAGSLSASNETIGYGSTGVFNQSGGTHTVTNSLTLGQNGGSTGSYTLNAGSLSARDETIGWFGNGVFTQSGGTHMVTGTMTLAAYTGSSGTYNLQGGLLKANAINAANAGATFNFTGGTLSVGQFTGNLVNNGGTLAPGNSPGAANITGNYTQSASGTYAVELGGLLAGTQYDTLNVTGTAFLDGLLNVSLFDLGGGLFAPHAGDHFDILTASTILGSFNSLSFAALSDPNLFWRIDYLTDAIGTTDVVRLSVAQNVVPTTPVPEPETYAMLLAGLGLLGFAGRRRNGVSRQAA